LAMVRKFPQRLYALNPALGLYSCTCCRALVVEDRKTASGVAHINFFGGFWSGFLRSLDVRGVFARVCVFKRQMNTSAKAA
jgi:hypothetical protein